MISSTDSPVRAFWLSARWEEEQERRRKFDAQRASELRTQTVDSNLRKGRNKAGRCAWCGQPFNVIKGAIQDPIDHLWYHVFSSKTVRGVEKTCYVLHKPHLKNSLRAKQLAENEWEEEQMRRSNFDRDLERQKALRNRRDKLKKAFMADGVAKLAKRTGQKLVDVRPPYAVHITFSEAEFDQSTKESRAKRAFAKQCRADVSNAMRLNARRVTMAAVLRETCIVELHLHQDPDGNDLWYPEALARKLCQMINKKNGALYQYDVLAWAISAEVKGVVISPVAAALLDADDVDVHPLARPSRIPPPDHAGKVPIHVYFCAEYDDMRPEREFFFANVFPVIDKWLAAFRCQFVPVDMRFGITRSECFHPEVVRFL